MRALFARRYIGHLENSAPVTSLVPGWMVTYAHGSHKKWNVGDPVPVLLLTAVNQKFPLGFSSKDIDPDWLPVVGFVEKPVEFPVLLEKVKAMLASAPSPSQPE